MSNLPPPDRRFLQTEDPFVLDDLKQMEYAKRYNFWLYSLIRPYLGKRVLEIGPGIGNISRLVTPKVELLVGMEPNAHCAQVLSQELGNNPHFHLIESKVEEGVVKELLPYQFDTILCMNVIEHIKDDQAVINFFETILISGGRTVIWVPAIPQAYGPIDRSLGHFRRYTISSMKKIFEGKSIRIEKITYSNFVGLLGWMFNARIRKSIKQNNEQIRLFDAMVPFLSRIEQVITPPIGLSILVVGRKSK